MLRSSLLLESRICHHLLIFNCGSFTLHYLYNIPSWLGHFICVDLQLQAHVTLTTPCCLQETNGVDPATAHKNRPRRQMLAFAGISFLRNPIFVSLLLFFLLEQWLPRVCLVMYQSHVLPIQLQQNFSLEFVEDLKFLQHFPMRRVRSFLKRYILYK